MRKVAGVVPDALMLAGGLGALAGLYLMAGLAATLLVGGFCALVVGFLLEMSWSSPER